MNLSHVKNLNPRQKLILAGIGGSLMCFIIYLVMHFTILDIKKLKMSIVDQKINMEKQQNMSESTIRLSNKLKKIEPQLKKFDRIFINKNRELEFITALEDIAGKNKITQKIKLPPPSPDDNKFYSTATLSIESQGAYSNLINYLSEIEALNYYISINSVVLDSAQKNNISTRRTSELRIGSSESAGGGGDSVYMNISAETYWK